MQTTPPCLSLLLSLIFVSLTGSAPLGQGQGDDTDYLKWSEVDSDTGDLMDYSVTPLSIPSMSRSESQSLEEQEREEWEEEILQGVRRELQEKLNRSRSQGLEKRYRPSGYMASRGKRFLPGLESLLLAKYYKDNKWKRQPHYGFHGSRG